MVTDDAERTMNTFLGITGDLGAHEIDESALKSSEMLYIEGYLASSEKALTAAIYAHQFAKKSGIKVALTFSDPAMVTYFKDQVSNIVGDGVDLLFCNEQEAMIWTGKTTIEEALSSLSGTAAQWVCTRGRMEHLSLMEEVSLIYQDAKSRLSTPTVPETCSQAPFYMDSQMGGVRTVSILRRLCFRILDYTIGPRLEINDHARLLEEFKAI